MAIISTDPSYTFTVTGNRTLTAVFEQIPIYTITATIDPEGSGTVTGAGQYQEGATVTLVATPSDGYEFTGWQENGQTVSADNPYTFAVEGDRTLVGEFSEKAPSRLPSGYTELQYVETAQKESYRINTGITINLQAFKLELDIKPNDANGSYAEYIFSAPFPGNYYCYAQRASDDSKITGIAGYSNRYGSGEKTFSGPFSNRRVPIIVDFPGGKFQIGDSLFEISPENVTSTSNFNIFDYYVGTSRYTCSISAKLFSAKIYNGDDLQCEFVPCTSPDGVIGLYDLARGLFCENSTESELIAGPAV